MIKDLVVSGLFADCCWQLLVKEISWRIRAGELSVSFDAVNNGARENAMQMEKLERLLHNENSIILLDTRVVASHDAWDMELEYNVEIKIA